MNRQRIFRGLRIAWTVGFGIACLLLVVLWVRSYRWTDSIHWGRSTSDLMCTIYRGDIGIVSVNFGKPLPISTRGLQYFKSNRITSRTQVNYNDGTGRPLPSYLGFKSSWLSAKVRRASSIFVVPFWFPAVACGVVGIIPWVRRFPTCFSLRALLIAVTFLAVGMGVAVWLVRN